MNPKIALVALASAVFGAGFTYWAVAPRHVAARAAIAPPAGPPLVISTAGPETPSAATQSPVTTAPQKPSPIVSPQLDPSANPEPAVVFKPVPEKAAELKPLDAKPPDVKPTEPKTIEPGPPPAPPPPQRAELTPPKEVDRAQPAILREKLSTGPNTVTITQGTWLYVRTSESLLASSSVPGDTFFATLEQPLVAGGFVIAERGARVEGKIIETNRPGGARMSVAITRVNSSDGQRIPVETSTYSGSRNLPIQARFSVRIERPVTLTERVVQ